MLREERLDELITELGRRHRDHAVRAVVLIRQEGIDQRSRLLRVERQRDIVVYGLNQVEACKLIESAVCKRAGVRKSSYRCLARCSDPARSSLASAPARP